MWEFRDRDVGCVCQICAVRCQDCEFSLCGLCVCG